MSLYVKLKTKLLARHLMKSEINYIYIEKLFYRLFINQMSNQSSESLNVKYVNKNQRGYVDV